MINLNPGFHMIATIAVIAAIAEKKSDPSDQYIAIIWNHKHSPAIAATTIAGDRCRCDRWRVVSIWSLNFFFSAIAAITAIVAIIFTFPFLFFTFWFSLRHSAFRLRIRFLFFTFPFPFLTFWFSLLHFAFRLRFRFLLFYFSISVSNFFIFTDLFRFTL